MSYPLLRRPRRKKRLRRGRRSCLQFEMRGFRRHEALRLKTSPHEEKECRVVVLTLFVRNVRGVADFFAFGKDEKTGKHGRVSCWKKTVLSKW